MPSGGPPSERVLQTRWYPLFRLGGSAALALGAVLHNVVVLEQWSAANLVAIVGGLLAWALLTWLALIRWYGRTGRFDLGYAVALGVCIALEAAAAAMILLGPRAPRLRRCAPS